MFSRHLVLMKKAAIIPHSEQHWQSKTWQAQLASAFRRPVELLSSLNIDKSQLSAPICEQSAFPLLVPQSFAARMEPGNPNDPLLVQVLPIAREREQVAGFVNDPLAEASSNPIKGLVHKYHNRVLLVATGGCAINCRYCFRRHFDYAANNPSRDEWQTALEYIAKRPEIDEVILSGGDPLLLNDRNLGELVAKIEKITHIKRLRIHSRIPIVLPARTTSELIATLSETRLKTILVTHANHPNEINAEVMAPLRALHNAGVTLLNQSVLLKGINDAVIPLQALSEALFEASVLPYYLHLPDRVAGTAHFIVDDHDAKALYQALQTATSGYLVPKLVREIPGWPSKQRVGF